MPPAVDLYISTFGPVLSIISENWPVLTSESDPKTGDPLPLKPGEALDSGSSGSGESSETRPSARALG